MSASPGRARGAHRGRFRGLAGLVASLLALSACSGGGHSGTAAPTTTSTLPPTTTTTAPPTFPLTGVAAGTSALAFRPALVVKIENAPESRPQSGLDAADVVYEEVVEGGISRFLAVFQSADASVVGPVRSVRPSDPDLVRPLGGLFAYSGGTSKFINLLHEAPVHDVGFDALDRAYYRRKGRISPHNLYSSTQKLYEQAAPGDQAPPPLFKFLPPGAPLAAAGAVPATHLAVVLGDVSHVEWDWDAATGSWKRSEDGSPHLLDGGAQVHASNVLVQFVTYSDSPGDFDVNRQPVQRADLVGSGEAWVLSGGELAKGRWTKSAPDAVISYTDANGAPMALAPGHTWVELAPVGAPTVVW
ncbi:MAG: DUF3048 domain-containing protein [Acidimicrobiales bacterium]